jgi:hypothetical protein
MALVSSQNGGHGTHDTAAGHSSSATQYVHMAMDMASHNGSAGGLPDHSFSGAGAADHSTGQGFHSPSATDHSIGHGSPIGGADHGTGDHGFSPPSTAEHGIGSADAAQVHAVPHSSSANQYMSFVQGESGHDAMSHGAGGEQPGTPDTMTHAGSGLQEPL